MADENTEAVAVTQADRDAVQRFHREMAVRLMSDVKYRTNLLDVRGDDSDALVQAFARHRLASLTTQHDNTDLIARVAHWLRHDLHDWPDYVAPADIADAIEQEFAADALQALHVTASEREVGA